MLSEDQGCQLGVTDPLTSSGIGLQCASESDKYLTLFCRDAQLRGKVCDSRKLHSYLWPVGAPVLNIHNSHPLCTLL